MEFRKCDEFMNLIKEDKSEVGEEDRSRISSSSESFISSSYLSYTKSFGSSTDESSQVNSSILGDKDKDHWEAVRKCSADTTNDISEIETDLDDVGFEDEKIQQNDAKNRVSKENQERKCWFIVLLLDQYLVNAFKLIPSNQMVFLFVTVYHFYIKVLF